KQTYRIAVASRLLDRALDEILHIRKAGKIGVDVLLRLLARDLEVLREAEGGDAVDDAEVDHLRDRAVRGRELRRLLAKHLDRGRGVDVVAAGERLTQLRLPRHVREDAQLDLRVVSQR